MIYGHYFDRVIPKDAKQVLQKSVARYVAAINGTRGYWNASQFRPREYRVGVGPRGWVSTPRLRATSQPRIESASWSVAARSSPNAGDRRPDSWRQT